MALPLARPSRRRHDPMNPRKSNTLLIVMILYALYTLVPLVWLLFSSTKTQAGLFSSFGLWFADDFAFIDNLVATFSYRDGIFLRWLGNTLLYGVVGAGGATLLATMAGYGLAKFRFPGRRAVFAVVLGAVAVPGTALAVPTFLLFSRFVRLPQRGTAGDPAPAPEHRSADVLGVLGRLVRLVGRRASHHRCRHGRRRPRRAAGGRCFGQHLHVPRRHQLRADQRREPQGSLSAAGDLLRL